MSEAENIVTPGATEFRKAMGLFTTGVCIVAVGDPGSELTAMTVNSFVSVSLDPMLICWSLHNDSSQFARYTEADRFSVSVLSGGQTDLARRYAMRGGTQVNDSDFAMSAGGFPVVDGAIGHFECRRWALNPAGDHTMILGEVTGLHRVDPSNEQVSPLTFFKGEFCSIGRG